MTLKITAHSLSTIQDVEQIIFLKEGSIFVEGKFQKAEALVPESKKVRKP
jgi:ABC-type transport system involved in Fe-S cluster assembly fused permease/ATPase subunit